MTKTFQLKLTCFSAVLLCALSSTAHAAFITNGGFEADFTGWSRSDQPGSDGSFLLQTGTLSPVNGMAVPAPPGGTTAAMSDTQGPGSHVLYQDIVIPSPVISATLVFYLFIGNRATMFATPSPASLDFSTPALNQQARVDLLLGSAGLFSLTPADVLLNLFQTSPGNPLVSGYATHSVDITAVVNSHVGETLRVRFAETDNLNTFQLGVDNVDIVVGAVPEPGSWTLAGGALLTLLAISWKRPAAHRENF